MLMMTAIGVGAFGSAIGGGSSIVRSLPPTAPGVVSGFSIEGDDGRLPPLQLHIVSAQTMAKAEKTEVRAHVFHRSKADARRKL